MAIYWNIDSGDGNELTAGIQSEDEARRIAQATANRLGESVYLYEVGAGDGESEADSEEIAPDEADGDAPAYSEIREAASTVEAGEYLIEYEDSGLTADEDPGSRCGFDDAQWAELSQILKRRGLRTATDDRGHRVEVA